MRIAPFVQEQFNFLKLTNHYDTEEKGSVKQSLIVDESNGLKAFFASLRKKFMGHKFALRKSLKHMRETYQFNVVADVKSLLQTGLHTVLSCVSYITAHLFETVGVCALYLLLTWKTTRISIGGSACKISNNRGCGKRIRGKLTHWRINSRSGQATEASFKIA